MNNAQDAVREIKEWPVQKYLIENEDGSIEFSDNKPGRVVCTKGEFMEAKAHKTYSWMGIPDSYQFMATDANGDVFAYEVEPKTRESVSHWYQSKATRNAPLKIYSGRGCHVKDWRDTLKIRSEAHLRGYVKGFDGRHDDMPKAPIWIPLIGIECEKLWTSPDEYYRVKVFGYDGDEAVGKWLDGPQKGHMFAEKQYAYTGHYEFRPLKSDRERWIIEAQKHCVEYGDNNIGRIYDALISGELPTPEAK